MGGLGAVFGLGGAAKAAVDGTKSLVSFSSAKKKQRASNNNPPLQRKLSSSSAGVPADVRSMGHWSEVETSRGRRKLGFSLFRRKKPRE